MPKSIQRSGPTTPPASIIYYIKVFPPSCSLAIYELEINPRPKLPPQYPPHIRQRQHPRPRLQCLLNTLPRVQRAPLRLVQLHPQHRALPHLQHHPKRARAVPAKTTTRTFRELVRLHWVSLFRSVRLGLPCWLGFFRSRGIRVERLFMECLPELKKIRLVTNNGGGKNGTLDP